MRLFKYKVLITAITTVLAIGACKRTSKDENIVGPSIILAKPGFAVENDTILAKPTRTVVSFGLAGTPGYNVYFKAKFNQVVTWKLLITSRVNGAYKVITGTSDSLGRPNEWDGSSDYRLFSADICDVELTIAGLFDENKEPIKYKTWFKTITAPKYLTSSNGSTNKGPYKTFESGSNFAVHYNQDTDLNALFKFNQQYPDGVNGKYSMWVTANDLNSDGFCGGFQDRATGIAGLFTSSDPNNVYVNMYVKGFNKPNSTVKVFLYELDSISNFSSSNLKAINDWSLTTNAKVGIATHPALLPQGDVFEYSVTADWDGWKLVSIKYSDFKKATSVVTNGNGIKEPMKARELSLEINSFPNNSSDVEIAIDNIVLSTGGPFKP